MGAIVGYKGSVKLGANTVGAAKTWQATIQSDEYDTTTLGLNAKTYLPGLIGGDVKMDLFYDPLDTTGMIAIQNALLNGTILAVNLYVDATHNYSGNIVVKQVDIKQQVNGTVDASVSATFTGPITFS